MPGPTPPPVMYMSEYTPWDLAVELFQEPIESSQKLPWQGFQKKPQKIRREKRRGEREVKREGEEGSQKLESNQKPYSKSKISL